MKIIEEKEDNLKVITQPINTTNAIGKLFFHLFAVLTEFESETIKERTRAGVKAAKNRGAKTGQPQKLTNKDLEKAAKLKLDGMPYTQIGKQLSVSKSTIYNYKDQIEKIITDSINDLKSNSK